MQENEFENQVQQKMEELKLNPSPSVWQNIQRQIKREKRRRWGLIFLPLLLICFLFTGAWLWNSGIRSTHKFQQQPSNNSVTQKNAPEKIQTNLDSIKNTPVISENKKQFIDSITLKNNTNKNILAQNKIKIPIHKIFASDNLKKPVVELKIEKPEPLDMAENKKLTNTYNEIVKPENIKAPDQQYSSDSLSNQIVLLQIKKKEPEKKNSKNKEAGKSINKNPWNWGFALSGGISDIADKFLASENKSAGADLGSIGGSPDIQPSKIKSSAALTTGFFIARNISKKTAIKLGLNYKLFSTTNKVGADSIIYYQSQNYVNSIIYYRSQNSINRYHNYFHLIELPIILQVQIGSAKKIPVFWNAGVSISRLIGTNALQFNKFSGLYYHDNSLFNKTQLGFTTGITVSLFSKQKTSVLIGPYIYYDVTKIASEGLYKNKHFTSVELRTQIIFRKK